MQQARGVKNTSRHHCQKLWPIPDLSHPSIPLAGWPLDPERVCPSNLMVGAGVMTNLPSGQQGCAELPMAGDGVFLVHTPRYAKGPQQPYSRLCRKALSDVGVANGAGPIVGVLCPADYGDSGPALNPALRAAPKRRLAPPCAIPQWTGCSGGGCGCGGICSLAWVSDWVLGAFLALDPLGVAAEVNLHGQPKNNLNARTCPEPGKTAPESPRLVYPVDEPNLVLQGVCS